MTTTASGSSAATARLWKEALPRWRDGLAHDLHETGDLDVADMLELANAGALPGASDHDALYADHADEFQACA